MSEQTSFDVEDAEVLLKELHNFYDVLQKEWSIVLNQWASLKNSWLDEQYYKFEPLFDNLASTYILAKQECEIYITFLQKQIEINQKQRFNLLQALEKPIAIAQLGASLIGMNANPITQTSTELNQRPNFSYVQDKKTDSCSLNNNSDPEISPEFQQYNAQPAIFRSMGVEDQLNEAYSQEEEKQNERRKKQANDSADASNRPKAVGFPPDD